MKICLKLIIANKKKLAELGSKVHKSVATAKLIFCMKFFS